MSGEKIIPLYRLGARTPCVYCDAILFPHEEQWGQLCCMKSQVLLQPIIEHLEIDVSTSAQMQHRALCLNNIVQTWKATTEVGNVLRKYARQLNNALSMASVTAVSEVVPRDGGWAPSVIICVKVYTRLGPLRNNSPGTARNEDMRTTTQSMTMRTLLLMQGHMRLPAHVTTHERNCLRVTLHQFQSWLRGCNPYVQDF